MSNRKEPFLDTKRGPVVTDPDTHSISPRPTYRTLASKGEIDPMDDEGITSINSR